MKTTRLHRLHRSFAHSAAAALICLAAALTSASPVAAHAAPPPDREKGQKSCHSTDKQSQGLENIVSTVLFGHQNTTKQEGRCVNDKTAGQQDETVGVVRPPLSDF